MKITTTTYELNQEESAVLLCELAHDFETLDIRTSSSLENAANDLNREMQACLIRQKLKKRGGQM